MTYPCMPKTLVRVVASSALALSAAGASVVVEAGPAAAKSFRPIICTAASQPTMQSSVVFTGCQRHGVTGGSGNLQGNGVNGNAVLTWKTGSSSTSVGTRSRGSRPHRVLLGQLRWTSKAPSCPPWVGGHPSSWARRCRSTRASLWAWPSSSRSSFLAPHSQSGRSAGVTSSHSRSDGPNCLGRRSIA